MRGHLLVLAIFIFLLLTLLCQGSRYLPWKSGLPGPLGRAIAGFPQVTSAGEGLGPAGSLIFAVFFSKERISRWSWAGPPSCGRRRRRWRRRGGGRGHLFVLAVFIFLLLTLLCQGNLVTFSITAMFFSAVGPQVGRAGAGRWVEHLYSAGSPLGSPPSSVCSTSSSTSSSTSAFIECFVVFFKTAWRAGVLCPALPPTILLLLFPNKCHRFLIVLCQMGWEPRPVVQNMYFVYCTLCTVHCTSCICARSPLHHPPPRSCFSSRPGRGLDGPRPDGGRSVRLRLRRHFDIHPALHHVFCFRPSFCLH